MTILKPVDFKSVIENVYKVNSLFGSNGNSDEIYKTVMYISEPIISCKYIDKGTLSNYSQACVSFAEKIKNNESVLKEDIDRWNMFTKVALAVAFTNMSVQMRGDGTYYNDNTDELYALLVDYFKSYAKPIVYAYYHAVRRYSYKRPEFCFNSVMEIFRNVPTVFTEMYNDCIYVYSPETAVDKIYSSCPICGASEAEPHYCAEQSALYEKDSGCKLYSPAKLWMKCKKCNNLYAYNFPAHSFEEIYNTTQDMVDTKLVIIHEPRSYQYRFPKFELIKMSDVINKIRMYNTGDKYLEIGLGTGEMLAVATEMGYDVTAVEISRDTCEQLSAEFDIDVYLCDFMKFDTNKKFDVIVMGDVLEHVSRPMEALQKAYDLLAENGVLWLSTPNYECSFGKFRKFADPMWNEKQHFTYFSYQGLKPICEKIGFEIKRYDVSERYNGSMELILKK